RVLAPGETEALVEAAQTLEQRAQAEAVGGHEARLLEAVGVALVIGRTRRYRHDDAAPGRLGAICERSQAGHEPVAIRAGVVVGERDDASARCAPAMVAGGGRPVRPGRGEVA